MLEPHGSLRSLVSSANTIIGLTTVMSSTRSSASPVLLSPIARRVDLFPTTTFRQAYDRLVSGGVERADREYVRILHLAATTSEAEVETALQIVLEEHKLPSFLTVRDLVQVPTMRTVPALSTPELNLASYDQLIPSSRRACV
jgi:hypothetical protein